MPTEFRSVEKWDNEDSVKRQPGPTKKRAMPTYGWKSGTLSISRPAKQLEADVTAVQA